MTLTAELTETRTIHTISELNQMVRCLLDDAFPLVWIEGEISNFSCPSSGHWYFTLKDSGAQVRCAMFQGKNRALGFQPSNGTHVIARAKISLYEPRGEYQLVIDFLEEAGDGALQRAFAQLKAKLAQEGLFASDHKKPLPTMAKTVGVITSATGAAIRDILTVLRRRFPSMAIIIYPTAVQGTQAGQQIARALQVANQRAECDVLIVARGGGSLEDLWAFNEEIVARAIFASIIPVISAVGHEIDFTIADFVADVRAPTPSAAAELVSPDATQWSEQAGKIMHTLIKHMRNLLAQQQHILTALLKQLRHPGQRIRDQFQRVDEYEQRLKRALQNYLNDRKHRLANLFRALDAVSPLATLSRGYAIVSLQNTGEILRNAQQANIGDKITARLKEGALECVVSDIK